MVMCIHNYYDYYKNKIHQLCYKWKLNFVEQSLSVSILLDRVCGLHTVRFISCQDYFIFVEHSVWMTFHSQKQQKIVP